MKKRVVSISVLILVGFMFSGCALFQGAVPETPDQYRLKARLTLDGLLSDYIVQKRTADAEQRVEWTKEIDPWFIKAAAALDMWDTIAENGGDVYEQQRVYLEIKNQLLAALLANLTKEKK